MAGYLNELRKYSKENDPYARDGGSSLFDVGRNTLLYEYVPESRKWVDEKQREEAQGGWWNGGSPETLFGEDVATNPEEASDFWDIFTGSISKVASMMWGGQNEFEREKTDRKFSMMYSSGKKFIEKLQKDRGKIFEKLQKELGTDKYVGKKAKEIYSSKDFDILKVKDYIRNGYMTYDAEGNLYVQHVKNNRLVRDTSPVAKMTQNGDILPYDYWYGGDEGGDSMAKEFRQGATGGVDSFASSGLSAFIQPISDVKDIWESLSGTGDAVSSPSPYFTKRGEDDETARTLGAIAGFGGQMLLGAGATKMIPAARGISAGKLGAGLGFGLSAPHEFAQYARGEQSLQGAVVNTGINTGLGAWTGLKAGEESVRMGNKLLGETIKKKVAPKFIRTKQALGQARAQMLPSLAGGVSGTMSEMARTGQDFTSEEFAGQVGKSFLQQLGIGMIVDYATPYATKRNLIGKSNYILENTHPKKNYTDNQILDGMIKEGMIDPDNKIDVEKTKENIAAARDGYEKAGLDHPLRMIMDEHGDISVKDAPDDSPMSDVPEPMEPLVVSDDSGVSVYKGKGVWNLIKNTSKSDDKNTMYNKMMDFFRKNDIVNNEIRKPDGTKIDEQEANYFESGIAAAAETALGIKMSKIPVTEEVKVVRGIYDLIRGDEEGTVPVYWADPEMRGKYQDEYSINRPKYYESPDMTTKELAAIKSTKMLAAFDRVAAYKHIHSIMKKDIGLMLSKNNPNVTEADISLAVAESIKDIFSLGKNTGVADIPTAFTRKMADKSNKEIYKIFKEEYGGDIAEGDVPTPKTFADQPAKEFTQEKAPEISGFTPAAAKKFIDENTFVDNAGMWKIVSEVGTPEGDMNVAKNVGSGEIKLVPVEPSNASRVANMAGRDPMEIADIFKPEVEEGVGLIPPEERIILPPRENAEIVPSGEEAPTIQEEAIKGLSPPRQELADAPTIKEEINNMSSRGEKVDDEIVESLAFEKMDTDPIARKVAFESTQEELFSKYLSVDKDMVSKDYLRSPEAASEFVKKMKAEPENPIHINFKPNSEVVKSMIKATLGLSTGYIMSDITDDESWMLASVPAMLPASKRGNFSGKALFAKIGGAFKLRSLRSPTHDIYSSTSHMQTTIRSSPEIKKFVKENPKATKQEIDRRVAKIVEEANKQDEAINTNLKKMFMPIDMLDTPWAKRITKAAQNGSIEGNKYINKISSLKDKFSSGMDEDEIAQVVATNTEIYRQVTDAVNEIKRGKKLRGKAADEAIVEAIMPITSAKNIRDVMHNVHNLYGGLKPVDRNSTHKLMSKYNELRAYLNKRTEAEIYANAVSATGMSVKELQDNLPQWMAELKSIRAQKKVQQNVMKDLRAAKKKGDMTDEEYDNFTKKMSLISVRLAFADETGLKNMIDHAVNARRIINQSEAYHHIDMWNVDRKSGGYALSIEEITPTEQIYGSRTIFRKKPPNENRAKLFTRFKNAQERQEYRDGFFKEFNVKRRDDLGSSEFFEMDAMDRNGNKIYGENNRPERVVVKVNEVDMDANKYYKASAGRSKEQLRLTLDKMLANAGALIDSERAVATAEGMSSAMKANVDKLKSEFAADKRQLEELLKPVLDYENVDGSGNSWQNDFNDLTSFSNELFKTIDEFQSYMNDIESVGINVLDRVNLYDKMRSLFEYSLKPKAPIYRTPNNHWGWQRHVRGAKDFAKLLDVSHDDASGLVLNRMENGFRLGQVEKELASNREKGMYNDTYHYLLDHYEMASGAYGSNVANSVLGRMMNSLSTLMSVKVLAGNMKAGLFNHSIGLVTALADMTSKGGGWKEVMKSPTALARSYKSSLGKVFESMGSSTKKKAEAFADGMDSRGSELTNPFQKGTIRHKIYQEALDGGVFGENIVKYISQDYSAVPKNAMDKLMFVQRGVEFTNRSFSFMLEMERLLKTRPKPSNVSEQDFIRDIVIEGSNFVTNTQGRFGLAWRSPLEAKMASNPYARSMMTLMSPAFRQLYIWEDIFRKAFKASSQGKREFSKLFALGLGTMVIGGASAIPGISEVWQAINWMDSDLDSKDLDNLKLKDSWYQSVRKSIVDGFQAVGLDEKSANSAYKSLVYGVWGGVTDKSMAFDGGVTQFMAPLVVGQITQMLNSAQKIGKPGAAGYMMDAYLPVSLSRAGRGAIQTIEGEYLGKGLTEERMGGKFSPWDGIKYSLFSKDISDIEATRAEFEDPVPMTSPQQRRDYMESIIGRGGISLEDDGGLGLTKKGATKYISKVFEKEDLVDDIRNTAMQMRNSETYEKSLHNSKEMLSDFLENPKVRKSIEKYLGFEGERVYGQNKEVANFVRNMERDVTKYYESIVQGSALNKYLTHPSIRKYFKRPVQISSTWAKFKSKNEEHPAGSYPIEQQGFHYARMRLINKLLSLERSED